MSKEGNRFAQFIRAPWRGSGPAAAGDAVLAGLRGSGPAAAGDAVLAGLRILTNHQADDRDNQGTVTLIASNQGTVTLIARFPAADN
jgi:hypothetical protein